MWKELIRTLGDISAAYEKIFALGKKKHDYLVMIKMKELEPLIEEEERLVNDVHRLEGRRQSILVKLAGSDKSLRADMTMAELIAFAPNTLQHTLAVLHKQLSGQVAEVVKQNEINTILAMGALDAVTKRLNQIGNAKVEPTYGKGGNDLVSHGKKFEIKA